MLVIGVNYEDEKDCFISDDDYDTHKALRGGCSGCSLLQGLYVARAAKLLLLIWISSSLLMKLL